MTTGADVGASGRSGHNGAMNPFARRGLPTDLEPGLRAHVGTRPRVLAWAAAAGGAVVALPDRLAVLNESEWSSTGWQDILRGGWDADASALHWTGPDGERTLPLADPGRLPEVFRERVEATILVQRSVDLARGRFIIVSARRDPSGKAPVTWAFHPGPGVRLEDPETSARAAAELERLRLEYEF